MIHSLRSVQISVLIQRAICRLNSIVRNKQVDHSILIIKVFHGSAGTNTFVSQGKSKLFHILQETETVDLHICQIFIHLRVRACTHAATYTLYTWSRCCLL